jgi:hypothetical protein
VQLIPRVVGPDEVEQDVTQRDQFNTEEVGLAETLIREAHQNTMDGKADSNQGAVRTRIAIVETREEDADFWHGLLEPLRPHLNAAAIDLTNIDLPRPRLLVVEDFGTTGLRGAVDRKDEKNFSDFWRRMGRSHKGGSQGGRWGLGKLVFSSASRIRSFFGLTIQDDDPERTAYLMGQAVLRNHSIGMVSYAPHAFFAEIGHDGTQVPTTNAEYVARFKNAAALSRQNEPGLSVVVPCVAPDLNPETLLPFVIANWLFPILTGKLQVDIGEHEVRADNLEELARMHGGAELEQSGLIGFIRLVHEASQALPGVTFVTGWKADAPVLAEAEINELREAYKSGSLIKVRVPVTLKRKAGATVPSYIDAYMQASPGATGGHALFVRGAMTIPGESRSF